MNRRLLLACGLSLCAISASVHAQGTPTTAPAGLDALNDQRLMAELANRGLTSLLDRAFEINSVPQPQRDGLRTLVALRQLSDPKLTTSQRRALVAKIVAGIEQALPSLTDPRIMMQQATTLLQHGVERDVNTLEYWGDNPRTQAAVRPVIEAVIKLLDKSSAESQKQADALANAITGPNDPKGKQWEDAANLATTAAYTRHMVDYYLALSLDPAAPQRKSVAGQAIEYLKQFDNADSTIQPIVRNRIGKLHLVSGEAEPAKAAFTSIIDNKEIQPPADVSQQWEARYFSALADLAGGQTDAAQKSLDTLVAWQTANLPKDKATQDGASAATQMLAYRIASHIAAAASDPDAKKQANDRAIVILIDLVKKRPDLQSIIFDQLLAKLPENVDLKTLDPLLLQGFIAQADQERQKPESIRVDAKTLQRGIDAAKEMLRRQKTETIDPQLTDTAALLIPFFLERLGQPAEAAEAFLDYVKDFGRDPQNANLALDNAMAIIGKLRAAPATADLPATLHAYDRFLPIAIGPPFSRKEFAYEYARRLQLSGKAKEAVELFRQIPPNDKRLTTARFFEMVALQQRLDDEKLEPAERQQISAELAKLVDEVQTRLAAAMKNATTDAEKMQNRSMLVRTTLLAADVARRDQNDPQKTLKLLEQFESLATGLPNEKELIGNVLYTRVQAYMGLGDSNAATQTLVALLKTKPGGEGAAIVYNLLQKLNDELDSARLAGDKARMKVLAKNRAQLSGFLVEWARNNTDPNIRKYTYRYSVYDAATKHLAADLEDDVATRKAGLEAALVLYRKLESPESVILYRATLPPGSADANAADPAVALGIGLIAFDLGDFADAQKRLGQLLTDRKLGTPTVAIEENGQSKMVENDQYWEATLKLMQSNVKLAVANPADTQAQAAKDGTANYLKQLYVQWGRQVGGKKWSPEFEKLRAAIIPDFNPDDVAVGATEPSTQTTNPTTTGN